MSEDITEGSELNWLSSYGLMTVDRLLERYQLNLSTDEIVMAFKHPNTVYPTLMAVPFRHLSNHIILQQARDYEVYIQKLLIDYLLSGDSSREYESPGDSVREKIEVHRQRFIQLGEHFHADELAFELLIAESQAAFLQWASAWRTALSDAAKRLVTEGVVASEALGIKALNECAFHDDLTGEKTITYEPPPTASIRLAWQSIRGVALTIHEMMSPWLRQSSALSETIKQYRTDFQALILAINEDIYYLPEYKVNDQKVKAYQESLYFDGSLE